MFITFEGIDSSGKTTQIALLEKWFTQKNISYIVVREPGGTAISEKIRDILLDPVHEEMHEIAELFLFSSARAQLTAQIILPALKNNTAVLCDRYFDSTTAYQGYGRGIDLESIQKINALASRQFKPDLTFYIDIDFDESLRRKGLMNVDTDRMERSSKDFYNSVRNGYLAIAENESSRFFVLDGRTTIENLHRQIIDRIQKRFNI